MIKKITESPFMELALKKAKEAFKNNEVPVGAVIVDLDGNIISSASNKTVKNNDPTAHAEIIAIREACEKTGSSRLVNCDIYVTLEPCPMCAQAISFARFRSLYYGTDDKKGGGVENGARIFSSPSCHHRPYTYSGIYEKECSELLKDFFKKKR